MGRYCYFNTGFEYKFSFAVQNSSLDVMKNMDLRQDYSYNCHDYIKDNDVKAENETEQAFINWVEAHLYELNDYLWIDELQELGLEDEWIDLVTENCPHEMKFHLEIDLEEYLAELKEWSNKLKVELPNFESYEEDADGTERIAAHLDEILDWSNEEHTNFYLACCIYHQASYSGSELKGVFDI